MTHPLLLIRACARSRICMVFFLLLPLNSCFPEKKKTSALVKQARGTKAKPKFQKQFGNKREDLGNHRKLPETRREDARTCQPFECRLRTFPHSAQDQKNDRLGWEFETEARYLQTCRPTNKQPIRFKMETLGWREATVTQRKIKEVSRQSEHWYGRHDACTPTQQLGSFATGLSLFFFVHHPSGLFSSTWANVWMALAVTGHSTSAWWSSWSCSVLCKHSFP